MQRILKKHLFSKACLLFLAFVLVGCSSQKAIDLQVTKTTKEIVRFHPPLPPKLIAPKVSAITITPSRTRAWNDNGEPYVYYGFDSASYLTYATFVESLLSRIEHLTEIINYYRKESDQEKNKEE